MKHLPLCLLCSFGVALGAPQPQLTSTDAASPKRPPLSEDYRRTVKEWGAGSFYPNKPEGDVYQDVKRRDLHYLYAGFLEMFPGSVHKAEIESLMQRFYLFDAKARTTMSIADLKTKYNYDGDNGVFGWNKDYSPRTAYDKTTGVWRAPLCYGNLQFLSGGFIHHTTALEFLPGTQFIYPAKR